MKRLDFIDTAKGVCMLLIMLGHCAVRECHDPLIVWVYSFHTTTFFIITGFLIIHTAEYERTIQDSLIKNAKRLLIPYYSFQLIYSVFYCIWNGFSNLRWLLIDIAILNAWDYATWFLPVLFISKIAMLFLYRNTQNIKIVGIVVLFLFVTSIPISPMENLPLRWIVDTLCRCANAFLFLWIGMLLHKTIQKSINYKLTLIVSLTVSVGVALLNGRVSTFYLSYGNNPALYVIASIAGAMFVISVSNYAHSKVLTTFGQSSIIALGTHQLLLHYIGEQTTPYYLFSWALISLIVFGIIKCRKIIKAILIG